MWRVWKCLRVCFFFLRVQQQWLAVNCWESSIFPWVLENKKIEKKRKKKRENEEKKEEADSQSLSLDCGHTCEKSSGDWGDIKWHGLRDTQGEIFNRWIQNRPVVLRLCVCACVCIEYSELMFNEKINTSDCMYFIECCCLIVRRMLLYTTVSALLRRDFILSQCDELTTCSGYIPLIFAHMHWV